MPCAELPDDVLLDLDLAALALAARVRAMRVELGEAQPLVRVCALSCAAGACRLDKDDLLLAQRQVVADDDLVPIALERRLRLGDQQLRVRLELSSQTRVSKARQPSTLGEGLTLKLTTKPSGAHCSTIGLSTFGTWSISIMSEPLPD